MGFLEDCEVDSLDEVIEAEEHIVIVVDPEDVEINPDSVTEEN